MRHLIYSLFLLMACGCSTSTDVFEFDCVVKSTHDDVVLTNVAVTLKGQRVSGGSFNPNFQTLGTATTDTQGRFHISVDKDVFSAYRLDLTHPQHFTTSFAISPDDMPISTAYENTFALKPKAWVEIHVVNADSSQWIDLTVNGPSDGCADCCNEVRIIHEGGEFDTTFTCQMFGAELLSLSGNYRNSDGGTVIIGQEHAAIPFDTLEVQISY